MFIDERIYVPREKIRGRTGLVENFAVVNVMDNNPTLQYQKLVGLSIAEVPRLAVRHVKEDVPNIIVERMQYFSGILFSAIGRFCRFDDAPNADKVQVIFGGVQLKFFFLQVWRATILLSMAAYPNDADGFFVSI
ncbi:hypothetical protein WDW37_11910 [Bdellovibrionota bacterium FG-1]